MAIYLTASNQTVVDICVTIYGSLDYLTKLCFDNTINIDTELPPNTRIIYDNTFTPSGKKISTGLDLFNG